MQARVAEFYLRPKLLSRKQKLRVDLHGVSVFGPKNEHTLIRWEWITDMRVDGAVIVRSRNAEVRFPDGAFGFSCRELAELLDKARAIEMRGQVLGRLAAGS